MKMIYQNPKTDIITISVMQMVAASNNYGTPEQGQDLGSAETTDQTYGNLSRRHDVWTEDEDEEY